MPYLLDLTYDIIQSTELEAKFAVMKKKAWQPFCLVVHGFLDIYMYKQDLQRTCGNFIE